MLPFPGLRIIGISNSSGPSLLLMRKSRRDTDRLGRAPRFGVGTVPLLFVANMLARRGLVFLGDCRESVDPTVFGLFTSLRLGETTGLRATEGDSSASSAIDFP